MMYFAALVYINIYTVDVNFKTKIDTMGSCSLHWVTLSMVNGPIEMLQNVLAPYIDFYKKIHDMKSYVS